MIITFINLLSDDSRFHFPLFLLPALPGGRIHCIICAVCMNARLCDNLTSISAFSSPFDPEGGVRPAWKRRGVIS